MVAQPDRRRTVPASQRALEKQLNDEQVATLRSLEHFGWELKFVRRPAFKEPVPVVFDGDRKKFAVLTADGTLDENPGFEIRH
jgi:hypothetical protein